MQDIIDFQNPNKPKKKLKRKKVIIFISIIIIILAIIIMTILYASNKTVRKFLDNYLFRKNVTEEKLASIQLDYDSNVNIIGYNKSICVLAENTLKQYNASGTKINEIKLEISNPVYHVNNKYLAISEKNSSKLYVIADSKILWEKDVDGNISKIDVNKNGYVTVILTGTTHKSVIVTYDGKGNELFKTYRANATVIDASISPDNNDMAFAEINTSGTTIQSNIQIISIEKAKANEEDFITYSYDAPANCLITNIEYQNRNKLVCMYDDSIHVIANNQSEEIIKLNENDNKINNADIKLTNCVYRAIEKASGLFQADTVVEMTNIDNKKITVYTIEGVAKYINCYDNIIAVNLGQEVEFINTSGWLIKKYTSSQDVQGITITNGLAGIIYRDKVEIINL